MKILIVFAHPNRKSFCHAVLEQFTKGLAEAGHTYEVVDLYAIRFDPVFRTQDFASYVHESMPLEILDQMNLKQHVIDSVGGPIQRMIASRWLREKDSQAVARFIHSHRPKDVIAQWEKVNNAQGLAFIAPVYWCHFPAIMKGWFERVFSYGDAYALTPEGWRGEVNGRIPLLPHEKALIMTPTLFREEDYQNGGLKKAMTTIIDNWGLRYPGIKKVEHVYFYHVDDNNSQGYLQQAYLLGKDFSIDL
jgi:NAD(P)H dehydrogenase (quinone)